MGVMSGTLDLVQRAYLGTEIRDDVLRFHPRLTRPARRAHAGDAVPPRAAAGLARAAAGSPSPRSATARARRCASACATTSASCAAGEPAHFDLPVT